jgi:hypothetical protein
VVRVDVKGACSRIELMQWCISWSGELALFTIAFDKVEISTSTTNSFASRTMKPPIHSQIVYGIPVNVPFRVNGSKNGLRDECRHARFCNGT